MDPRSTIKATSTGEGDMNTGIRTCVIGSLLVAAVLWIDLAIRVIVAAPK